MLPGTTAFQSKFGLANLLILFLKFIFIHFIQHHLILRFSFLKIFLGFAMFEKIKYAKKINDWDHLIQNNLYKCFSLKKKVICLHALWLTKIDRWLHKDLLSKFFCKFLFYKVCVYETCINLIGLTPDNLDNSDIWKVGHLICFIRLIRVEVWTSLIRTFWSIHTCSDHIRSVQRLWEILD